MSLLEIHGRALMKKIIAQPNECRGYTQVQMSDETGIPKPIVSLVLRAAADRGMLERGMGRKRKLVVTQLGLDWMETSPPDDSIERVVTQAKRRRILIACLNRGMWQRDLELESRVSRQHLSIVLKWLKEKKHIYKSTLGWKTSPAGKEWLALLGVETEHTKARTRTCLMCNDVAHEGRWYCSAHLEFRTTLFRTNNDGSYTPSSGGMTI